MIRHTVARIKKSKVVQSLRAAATTSQNSKLDGAFWRRYSAEGPNSHRGALSNLVIGQLTEGEL